MRQIIVKPILTEKTINLASELNQYTFEVSGETTKKQVATRIAEKYEVEVESVRIQNRLGKIKRFGSKSSGRRKNSKRAIVQLNKKDKIDSFEIK